MDPEVDLDAVEDEEMPVDELDEDEEEITEIPVHGVATIEGRPTGDGRGFRVGSLSFGELPQPLGYEFESGHGSGNSRVAVIGRIDEFWSEPTAEAGVNEARWRGVIFPHKEYASQAVESIIDESYTGVSVIVDSVTVDVTEQREQMRKQMIEDRKRQSAAIEDENSQARTLTDEEIEEMLNVFVGDGTTPVTWFSEARIRRFDMVPTGAFIEGFTRLGHEFADQLTPEMIEASAAALADCGCTNSIEDAEAALLAAGGAVEPGAQPLAGDQGGIDYVIPKPDVHETIQEFAPGTKDGPGWITHPQATSRIRRYWVRGKGAGKIRWGVAGDFNRCRAQLAKYVQNPDWLAGLCANMHKEAIGVWPGQEGGKGKHSLVASGELKLAPLYSLQAAAAPVDSAYFENPNLLHLTNLTVDGDRVYGHIASWTDCHVGEPGGPGTCTLAPRSATGYAHYRRGTVMTTDGPVAVGPLTMGTGHAGGDLTMMEAVAHYDNTGTVVAHIACGDDAHGIWFSGRIRPGTTEEQIYDLAASGAVSGDWRRVGGNYELMASLVVNVPGFPIPNVALVASADMGMGNALVAAGIVTQEDEIIDADEPAVATLEAFDLEGAIEKALHRYEMKKLLAAAAPARAEIRARSLARARAAVAAIAGE